ncbi:MAG: HD domain-containing phosphohydrolase [bacterium]
MGKSGYAEKYTLKTVFGLIKAMIEEKDLLPLLSCIHDQTKDIIHAERCTIFVYDKKKQELWSWLSADLEVEQIRLPFAQGIAGQVAATKEIMIVNDVTHCPLFDASWDIKTGYQTKSILAVPMLARGSELIGVIEAINKREGTFDDYDGALLMAFASLAGTAVRDVERNTEREKFIENVVRSFSEAIDARSEFTAGHSRRVAAYAVNFAIALGLNETEIKTLYYAALLHDVGKIGIKDAIIDKPGRLTPEEYKCIKDHVSYTRNILNAIDFPEDLKDIPQIACSHHEQINGKGYPAGLTDNQIHKFAKMLSIIDVYESLTASDRPYRKALSKEEALDILEKGKGTAFDPHLVDLFIKKRVYQTEMRMHKRINVDLAIEYFIDAEGKVMEKKTKKGRIHNISQGGILFSSDRLFPFNKLIELVIHLPDCTMEGIAQVVRCNKIEESGKYNIGLQFVDLSSEDQKRLHHYIQERL